VIFRDKLGKDHPYTRKARRNLEDLQYHYPKVAVFSLKRKLYILDIIPLLGFTWPKIG